MPRSRRKALPPPILTIGPITVNRDTATVKIDEQVQRLRPKEALLLWTLMQHVNTVLSRAELMQKVWHTDFADDTRTLEVHIHWLRRRIEPIPRRPHFLHTVRGQGYVFRWEDPPPTADEAATPLPDA